MYIVLEHTRNFSARLIHFWMLIDAVWHGDYSSKTFNHVLLKDGDTIWEAVDEGVVRTNFANHYLHKKYKKPFNSKHVKIELNPIERVKLLNYLKEVEGNKYEYSNFIFHPLRTLTNKWFGSKSDKKLYCYELVIRALNASGKFDLDPYMNPREFYKIISKLGK